MANKNLGVIVEEAETIENRHPIYCKYFDKCGKGVVYCLEKLKKSLDYTCYPIYKQKSKS